MFPDFKHRINAGREAVLAQCDFFAKFFADVESDWKEDDSRVTFADFAISEKIFAELRRYFPKDDYCSEESDPADEPRDLTARYAWVLDPIDGTNNYALGMSTCGISLALLRDGMPAYGFFYDFSRNSLMEGGPGQGLFDAKKPVTIKKGELEPQSIIGLHFPVSEERLKWLTPLLTNYRARSLGSGALVLAYVASGRLDGCFDHKVKVWDVAASYALLLGGGGEAHFISESPFPLRRFCAQMPTLCYYAGTPAFCRMMHDRVKVL